MSHIHTNPGEHDFCASGFIVRLDDTDEPKILLHKHKKLGVFIQFGGHVELNENPWQALRHELREESGYDLDQLQLLQPPHVLSAAAGVILHPTPVALLTHDFDDRHKHTDIEYVFITTEAPRHAIAKDESHEIRGFTRADLDELTVDIPENVQEISRFIMDTCLHSWRPVDPVVYGL